MEDTNDIDKLETDYRFLEEKVAKNLLCIKCLSRGGHNLTLKTINRWNYVFNCVHCGFTYSIETDDLNEMESVIVSRCGIVKERNEI